MHFYLRCCKNEALRSVGIDNENIVVRISERHRIQANSCARPDFVCHEDTERKCLQGENRLGGSKEGEAMDYPVLKSYIEATTDDEDAFSRSIVGFRQPSYHLLSALKNWSQNTQRLIRPCTSGNVFDSRSPHPTTSYSLPFWTFSPKMRHRHRQMQS
ncbi:hypothetical protein BT69DRAFT_217533 [Atractiella rhizophila]|nr:hypothetical protein BT69DRAFT_217533 [Atractiella rhizophila]